MKQKTMKIQRIFAVIGIILILALYAAALICAFIDHPMANSILMSALFSTIVIPVMIFAFRYFIQVFEKKGNKDSE